MTRPTRAETQARLTTRTESVCRPNPVLSMRGTSYIEGPRPVRSGLRPPPSSLANLYRDETRAGFPYSFRGFAEVGCNTRRAGRAQRGTLSAPVSSLDFRGERLRRRLPRECSVYATVAVDSRLGGQDGPKASWKGIPPLRRSRPAYRRPSLDLRRRPVVGRVQPLHPGMGLVEDWL